MPDIKIIKLKLRRGLESQRLLITLDQGELGYTIDSKRVFVGDGATVGGIAVGSKAFTPIVANKTALAAVQGDIVLENSLLYQLTGTKATQTSAWKYIGPQADNTTIIFNASNKLTINTASPLLVYASGGLAATSQGLSANVDNSTITINNATNKINVGTINNTNINVSTLAGYGLGATAAKTLSANVDNATIILNAFNQIAVNPLTPLLVYAFGGIAATAQGLSAKVDNATVVINASNQIAVNTSSSLLVYASGGLAATAQGLSAKVDNASIQIKSNTIALSSLYNAARLPLSSYGNAFGGFYNQFPTGTKRGTTQYVASTGTGSATYTLSSAGFIVVDMGPPFGKKAIPVFDIPSELQALS
jgi:hypothetical protein